VPLLRASPAGVDRVAARLRRQSAARLARLSLPFHAHARLAANAGREAYAQGGATSFWKFHDAVYESPGAELDESGLEQFANKAGLDAARFRDSLTGLRHNSEIDHDVQTGDDIGVEGTPAFLVNDYFFVGAVPIEILRVIVDRALSDAGATAPSGKSG
jgi:protein-disulfide isomerase